MSPLDDDEEKIAGAIRSLPKERPVSDAQIAAMAMLLPSAAENGRRRRFLLAVAASMALLFFLGGTMTGRAIERRSAGAPTPQASHVLLVHEDLPVVADETSLHDEYARWAGTLAERGLLTGGEELSDDRMLIAPSRPAEPLHESARRSRTVGGYFLLAARDDAEALAIARDCPHLRHGGTVELRKIVRR